MKFVHSGVGGEGPLAWPVSSHSPGARMSDRELSVGHP